MIRNIRVWLWGIVAELEYQLYPWSTSDVPQWAVERYNLDDGVMSELDEIIYKEWIKAHSEKIDRLQKEMQQVQREIYTLQVNRGE